MVYPLRGTIRLKLALELVAGGNFVTIVIQTFPQTVPRVPAGLPFRRVRSGHRYSDEVTRDQVLQVNSSVLEYEFDNHVTLFLYPVSRKRPTHLN